MTTSPQNAQYLINKSSGKIHIKDYCGYAKRGANYFQTSTLEEARVRSREIGASTAGMCATCERAARKNTKEATTLFDVHIKVQQGC